MPKLPYSQSRRLTWINCIEELLKRETSNEKKRKNKNKGTYFFQEISPQIVYPDFYAFRDFKILRIKRKISPFRFEKIFMLVNHVKGSVSILNHTNRKFTNEFGLI